MNITFLQRMVWRLVVVLIILGMVFALSALGGCGTTSHIYAVHDLNNNMQGHEQVAVLIVEKQVTRDYAVGYIHMSHIFAGGPFNSDPENTMDGVYIKMRVW